MRSSSESSGARDLICSRFKSHPPVRSRPVPILPACNNLRSQVPAQGETRPDFQVKTSEPRCVVSLNLHDARQPEHVRRTPGRQNTHKHPHMRGAGVPRSQDAFRLRTATGAQLRALPRRRRRDIRSNGSHGVDSLMKRNAVPMTPSLHTYVCPWIPRVRCLSAGSASVRVRVLTSNSHADVFPPNRFRVATDGGRDAVTDPVNTQPSGRIRGSSRGAGVRERCSCLHALLPGTEEGRKEGGRKQHTTTVPSASLSIARTGRAVHAYGRSRRGDPS